MHALIPQSELVIVPGVGHSIHLEAPEIFAPLVHGFIGSVAGDQWPVNGND
jgi:pimeloyl-ACP methyl ester carboxylesterase